MMSTRKSTFLILSPCPHETDPLVDVHMPSTRGPEEGKIHITQTLEIAGTMTFWGFILKFDYRPTNIVIYLKL